MIEQALKILIEVGAESAIAALGNVTSAIAQMATSSQQAQETISKAQFETERFVGIVAKNTATLTALQLGSVAPFLSFLPMAVEVQSSINEINTFLTETENKFLSNVDAIRNYGNVSIPTLETVRKTAFDLFREFDSARAKVQTLTDDSRGLADQMKAIAKETDNSYSSTVLLNSSYDVLSAGFTKTSDVSAVMTNSVKLAKGGFTDLGTASDALTTILNAYGLSADQSTKVSNQLIQTQNLGKLTVDQYGKSIGQVATIAAQSGVGLEELNAAIAVATVKGLGASESITGLRQAISGIFNPTAQAKEVAAQLGIEFSASALKTKGLQGVLKDLNATGNVTPDVLSKLFGSMEAVSVLAPVLSNNMAGFDTALVSIKNSSTALDVAFEATTTSIDSTLKSFQNRFNESLLSMGEGIAGWTKRLIEQGDPIFKFFESLNPQNQIKFFEGLTGAAGQFGSVISNVWYQTTWLAGFTLAIILSEKVMSGLVITSTGLSATLQIGAARAFVMETATKAWTFATTGAAYITNVLTGSIVAQNIALDFAAAKTATLTFLQTNLGVAVAFVSRMAQAQIWIWSNTINWAIDGAAMLVKWTNAQLAFSSSIGVSTAATNIYTKATIALNVAWTYFATTLLPIIKTAAINTLANLKILIPNLLAILAKLALIVLAADAIANTFQILRKAAFASEFKKSLEGIEGSANRTQKSLDGLTLAPLNETGQYTIAVIQDMGDRFNYFVSNLGAGQDRAKGFIDNIAVGIVNVTNLLTGGQSAASKYGEQWRLITQAQQEAQQQALDWEAQQSNLNSVLDDGNDLINRYGLLTLEASDRTRLGKDGIKGFTDEVGKQIQALDKNIAVLKNVKTSDKEIQASIQATIDLYEKQKNILLGRIAFLNSEANATTETAITIDGLAKSYDNDVKSLERATNEKKVLIQEQQAFGLINSAEASNKLLNIDSDSYTKRLAIASKFQGQIKSLLGVTTNKDDQKKLNEQSEKIDADSLKARESIAKSGITNRDKIEKEAIAKFEIVNKQAEAAFQNSQNVRTALVKQAVGDRTITEEQGAIKLAQISQDEANQEVKIIQTKISQLQELEAKKIGDSKKNQSDLLGLQTQLSSANLKAVEAEITAQKAIQQEQIKLIENKATVAKNSQEKVINGLDAEKAALDRLTSSYDAQTNLLESRADLAQVQAEAVSQGIDQQIEKIDRAANLKKELDSTDINNIELKQALETELAELGFNANTTQLEFLKAKQAKENELAAQKREALLQEQQLQQQALNLDILRNDAARERANLEAQINQIKAQQSQLEAQAGLQKAQVGKNPQEIANAQLMLDLANQNVQLAGKQIEVVRESNEIGKQVDATQRQILDSTQKTALSAFDFSEKMRLSASKIDLAKSATEGLNKSLQTTTSLAEKAGDSMAKTFRSFDETIKSLQAPEGGSKLSYSFSGVEGINKAIAAQEKLLSLNNSFAGGGGGFDFGAVTGDRMRLMRANLEKAYNLSPGASTLISPFPTVGRIATTEIGNVGQSQLPRSTNTNSGGVSTVNNITIQDRPDPERDVRNILLTLGRI